MTMTLPAAIRYHFPPQSITHESCDSKTNDTRIAHETSKYGFVFARRGITMESCSSYFLPRLVGLARAMYLVSTGGVFPPNSRHFGPLFAETLPDPARVLPRALELATEMAETVSPMASALNRGLMWRGPESPEEAHLLESGVLYHMFRGKDQTEGVKAFFEKRKPDFKAVLESDGPARYPWWSEVDIDPKAKANSKL